MLFCKRLYLQIHSVNNDFKLITECDSGIFLISTLQRHREISLKATCTVYIIIMNRKDIASTDSLSIFSLSVTEWAAQTLGYLLRARQ